MIRSLFPSDTSKRTPALAGILGVLLLLAAVWSYDTMVRSRAAALDAAQDLETCRQLGQRIERLRGRPSLAGSAELQQGELTQRIELAARQANIPAERLIRVWPEASRRLGETPYREKPTQVLLRNVSLQQTVTLLHTLSSSEAGLQVKSLRITAPREGERGDLWTVEATLSYLIFSPQGDTPHRKRDL